MRPARDALGRLSAANPVPDLRVRVLVPESWSDQVLTSIVSQPVPVSGDQRRHVWRRLVLLAVVVALLVAPTYAVARSLIDGWLGGEPAPPSAVANFDSYTPQLGFQPDSGRAVVVAKDGGVSLYATTNDQETYCLATATPDGGICVSPAHAAAPLVAGIMPDHPARKGREQRVLVAGRSDHPEARTIRFTDPEGNVVARAIGSSGFFIAAVPMEGSPCANGDWTTTVTALGAEDEELFSARITLAHASPQAPGVCSWANGPHR
jgi:hypothetical protein